MITWDTTELDTLTARLTAAPARARPRIAQAVEITARKVRGTAQRRGRSSWMPGVSAKLDYTITNGGLDAEIETGDPFGLIREFGSARKAPKPFMRPALTENQADLEHGLTKAVVDTLKAML